MLDRGLRARLHPARSSSEARDDAAAPEHVARRDLRDLPTFTIDPATPATSTTRSPPSADGDGVRLWVHIADVAAYVAPRLAARPRGHRRGTSVYVPGAVEPMLPEALSSDACSLRPGRRPARGDGRDASSTGRAWPRRPSTARLIRSDGGSTTTGRRVFAGAEPPPSRGREPLARARASAARRSSDGARSARRAGGRDVRARVRVRRRGARRRGARRRPDRVAPADRAADDRANEQVAGAARDRAAADALPGPRAARPGRASSAWSSSSRPRRADAAAARAHSRAAGGRAGRARSARSSWTRTCARDRAAARARSTSLVLRSLKQAHYSPAQHRPRGPRVSRATATSPRRSAATRTSSCHRALLCAIGGGRARAAGARAGGGRRRARSAPSARRWRSSATPTTSARCFLLERELFARGLGRSAFEGEVSGVIGAGAFVQLRARRRLRGLAARAAPRRRLVGAQRGADDRSSARAAAGRCGSATRSSVQVRSVEAPRGRVDLEPGRAPRRRMSQASAKKRKAAPRRHRHQPAGALPLRAARASSRRASC